MADLKSNPFKQAAEKKKKAPGAQKSEEKTLEPIVAVAETAQEPQKEEQATVTPAEPENALQAVSEPSVDVLQIISAKKKKPKKASFALYLSEENMKKLGTAAKKAGMSKSEFVDHILTEVLK